MNAILVTIFLVSSLLQARWWSSFLPDLSVATLILLSLRDIPPWVYAIAVLGGILRDGLDVNSIWITPMIYLAIIWLGQFLREHINMSLYITKAVFIAFGILLFWGVKYLLVGHETNIAILTNLLITAVLILIVSPLVK